MALINDPKAWILRLFEMEEREGRGSDCVRFPDGECSASVPLEDGERVFGIYKKKYHFTPTALIIADKGKVERIPWSAVRSCSTQHGEGKVFSDLELADGRSIRVRVGDMATGWSGRISQLYHQMIERYGQRAGMGKPPMPVHEFFAKVLDDYSIAPNLEPHPTLESFRVNLLEMEQPNDGTKILMKLVEDSGESLVADGIVIVTRRPRGSFQNFAESFGADGLALADEKTIRQIGEIPEGFHVWQILWD
jgi:hypothetical protein